MNTFPADFSGGLTGFGGDQSKTMAEHRSSLQRTPVILVHGNGGHSAHAKWGMGTMKDFLLAVGYQLSEIWAMDYLGENNNSADLNDPHRNHIESFRRFVDEVKDYLGVEKLDFIAHSLGCGMVNAYLRGLQSSGSWDATSNRLDTAGTFVSLAGATYGLGMFSVGEFKTGSPFEISSHHFDGHDDDTPRGSNNRAEQEAPVAGWVKVTPLDDGEIWYVAIIADDDFVDVQHQETGRREGAHLNKRFNLGFSLDGHEKIIKSSTVFNAFKSFLNKFPPLAQTRITVDKDSGNYPRGLTVTVTVTPATATVNFVAERVTKQFVAGFIERTVADSQTGTLSDGGSLTLPADGAWDVLFEASGAGDLRRTYGTNIHIPEVQLLTDNAVPFWGSLEVGASCTSGTLYHSTDREHWTAGAVAIIDRTATVSFIAIDSDGIASPVASRAYEKAVAWTDRETGTLTAHFIAGRLSVNDYIAWGLELGFNAVLTLYLVDGTWVLNPEAPRAVAGAAALRCPALAASLRAPILASDKASGDYPGPIDVTLRAAGEGVTVYYTEDGSDPSDSKNPSRLTFMTQKTFAIRGKGHHAVLCHVQDGGGNWTFESFAWSINNQP